MNEFPFPKLLAFLKSEADQVEFMKVAAEVGIGPADMELAKLLVAFQLYKAFYADIPRQIRTVHNAALKQLEEVRDDFALMTNRLSGQGVKLDSWVAEIQSTISAIQPAAVAEELHQRLLNDALAALGGTMQSLTAAYNRVDTATATLNATAVQAEASIQQWQAVTLHRVWVCAFGACSVLTTLVGVIAWFIYSAH